MLTSYGELNPDDKEVMVDGLLAHHAKSGHERKTEIFNITLKDSDGKLSGVIIATILWNGLEINSLWIDEKLRGKGWGKKLMEEAEKEGVKKGATVAYTNTFPWQAPLFYEKIGYKLFGKLENFPKGEYLSYYFKILVP